MTTAGAEPPPRELRFRKADRALRITFADGTTTDIPFELLRVESPSAEARGHGGQRPPPAPGKSHVGVAGAEPVGRFAIRIRFDDGHDTGLYSWDLLRDLADNRKERMADYLARLADAGLGRE
jgi:DUF971 family protein